MLFPLTQSPVACLVPQIYEAYVYPGTRECSQVHECEVSTSSAPCQIPCLSVGEKLITHGGAGSCVALHGSGPWINLQGKCFCKLQRPKGSTLHVCVCTGSEQGYT